MTAMLWYLGSADLEQCPGRPRDMADRHRFFQWTRGLPAGTEKHTQHRDSGERRGIPKIKAISAHQMLVKRVSDAIRTTRRALPRIQDNVQTPVNTTFDCHTGYASPFSSVLIPVHELTDRP